MKIVQQTNDKQYYLEFANRRWCLVERLLTNKQERVISFWKNKDTALSQMESVILKLKKEGN